MANHDVDVVIGPPKDGTDRLSRRRWREALQCQPLPTDPPWAGKTARFHDRSGWTSATPEELWKALDTSSIRQHWQVDAREPGQLLVLRSQTRAGQTRLELTVDPAPGGGSRYHQRMAFHPHGLTGLLYWYGGMLSQALQLRARDKIT